MPNNRILGGDSTQSPIEIIYPLIEIYNKTGPLVKDISYHYRGKSFTGCPIYYL